jgi:4-hydroxybenzoate polyprenyltransferase
MSLISIIIIATITGLSLLAVPLPSHAFSTGKRFSPYVRKGLATGYSLGNIRYYAINSLPLQSKCIEEEDVIDVEQTVRSCIRPLFRMTRPSNIPGVILVHILGIHRALSSIQYSRSTNLISVLQKPQMMVVLIALLLISSTSMVVNDYYDARSGVDALNLSIQKEKDEPYISDKPFASGEVSMIVGKRFLSYLYAILLCCVTFVPGIPARLSIVVGGMLTFWYTQHLKPRTWLKNVSCAGLIALSPFTSGSAALSIVLEKSSVGPISAFALIDPSLSSLGRFVLTLFVGIMSREIIMDMCDYEGDKAGNIRTIPVKYGKRFASRASLFFASALGVLCVGVPALQLSSEKFALMLIKTAATRRFVLAAMGSFMIIRRAAMIASSEGEDLELLRKVVNEQKTLSFLLVLASFI